MFYCPHGAGDIFELIPANINKNAINNMAKSIQKIFIKRL